MDDDTIRRALGGALRRARGDQPLVRAGNSGVGHRTIDRLEHGINGVVTFEAVHRLAHYYAVSLGDVIRLVERGRGILAPEAAGAPGLEVQDAALRSAIRSRRVALGLGTPALARAARVHQTWLVRLESGEVPIDVVRAFRLAEALRTTLSELLCGVEEGAAV